MVTSERERPKEKKNRFFYLLFQQDTKKHIISIIIDTFITIFLHILLQCV